MIRVLSLIAASVAGCVACAIAVSFGYVLLDGGLPNSNAELEPILYIVGEVAIPIAITLGFLPGLLALSLVRDVSSEWRALPVLAVGASLGVLLGERVLGPVGYVLGGVAGLGLGVFAIRQFRRIRRA